MLLGRPAVVFQLTYAVWDGVVSVSVGFCVICTSFAMLYTLTTQSMIMIRYDGGLPALSEFSIEICAD